MELATAEESLGAAAAGLAAGAAGDAAGTAGEGAAGVALVAAAVVGLAATVVLVGVGEDAGAEQATVSMARATPPATLSMRRGIKRWDITSPVERPASSGTARSPTCYLFKRAV